MTPPARSPAPANPFKRRLLAGEACTIFGVRSIRHPGIVALAQASGQDAIYLDFQHSPIDMEAAAGIFQAGLLGGVSVLARLSHLEPALIGRLIDSGAHGLLVADLRSAAHARELVQAALTAPRGDRSLGLPIDPRFPGLTGPALMQAINDATLLVAMVESPEGIAAAEAIAAVEGIDALMVGSSDLSAALGVPGQFDHPRMLEAYQALAAACRAARKPFIAGGLRQPADLARCLALGAARCYFTGSDTHFALEGARAARARAEEADSQATRLVTPSP